MEFNSVSPRASYCIKTSGLKNSPWLTSGTPQRGWCVMPHINAFHIKLGLVAFHFVIQAANDVAIRNHIVL